MKLFKTGGIEALADHVVARWFSTNFRDIREHDLWRNMLVHQPDDGYIGCSAAIYGTDFFTRHQAYGYEHLASPHPKTDLLHPILYARQ